MPGKNSCYSVTSLYRRFNRRFHFVGNRPVARIASIENEVMTLDDSTIVYSGQGPATTVGHERATNPFLNGYVPGVR